MAFKCLSISSAMLVSAGILGCGGGSASAPTPTPAPSPTFADCYNNPGLLAQSANYEVDVDAYDDLFLHHLSRKSTVIGLANLNGSWFPAIDPTAIQTDMVEAQQVPNPDPLAPSYDFIFSESDFNKLSATAFVTYGKTTQLDSISHGSTTYLRHESYSPAIEIPFSLQRGVPHVQTYDITTMTVQSGTLTSGGFTRQQTTTFLGIEPLATAAGTFSTCKVLHSFVDSGFVASQPPPSYEWIIASGKYKGLLLKKSTEPTGTPPDTEIGTHLLLNGS